jgi:hypothetical protein
MMKKSLFLPVFCLLIPAVTVFAGADDDVWLCPGAETAMYGVSSLAYGGGFAVGYGKGISMGLKAAWFTSSEGTTTLELNFLLRYFIFGVDAVSGPFLQLTAGPALFAGKGTDIAIPSEFGIISAGLSFGWRFLFLNRWFVEPSIRGGYPYAAGAGLSAGVRF